ncbi:putative glucose-6-phosphate 1-epimerase [Morella rubra]|uniref:Putative glucose-6-phosphate 1-epimerase n=1 Tax=Morella rubra TaxID=262757 RepID=A0A6A1VHL8_9ROSI|nr:putative glucose-6-phosphate 1-epimerase [Morella rubra]
MPLPFDDEIAIIDHEKKRTFVLRKDGMPDAGVWNPWDRKAKALADLGDEDYKMMLCVDSSAIENSIILKPSEEWTGCQELLTVSSSYCSGQLDPRKDSQAVTDNIMELKVEQQEHFECCHLVRVHPSEGTVQVNVNK